MGSDVCEAIQMAQPWVSACRAQGGGGKGHRRREEQLLDNGLVKLITRHHSLWSVSLAVQSLGASRLCLLATVDCRASCDNTLSDQGPLLRTIRLQPGETKVVHRLSMKDFSKRWLWQCEVRFEWVPV